MLEKKELHQGNEVFRNSYFKKHEKELLELAQKGQHPKALFIGCSDSRVIPNLITQSSPGDLFVVRNVGNFVAPYKPDEDFHATASGIEYAVEVLNVSEIIVCGHTHCGAIAALFSEETNPKLIHTNKWLSLGAKAKEQTIVALGKNGDNEAKLRLAEKLSILNQIDNLLTYPSVKERVKKGKLHLHGWIYNIENGALEYFDPDSSEYKSFDELEAVNDK